MYEKITSENVVMFAIKHYDNPQSEGEKEFQDDLKRFKYIKRLLRKYYDTGVLKERLLLNHLIVLLNVFGADACATLLLYKIQNFRSSLHAAFCLDMMPFLAAFVALAAADIQKLHFDKNS